MSKKIKKRLIISYHNLTKELLAAFNEMYPDGYTDFIQKIKKTDGSLMFVIPFETEDTSYMVKVDVKIDERISENDFDKDLFGEDADEETTTLDEEGKESNSKVVLMHGDYSSVDRADEVAE
jgi:hypothetical protein